MSSSTSVLAANVVVDVQILAGDEAVFTELRSILGTWYCTLISVLLYTNPTIQATDLQYHAHVRTFSLPLAITF